MRKLYFLVSCIGASFLCINTVFAGSMEDGCFTILGQRANSEYGVDFTQVALTGSTKKTDISTYTKFLAQREKHGGDPIYLQKRTNIATIISNIDFIQTQMVGFGTLTNFTFPLKGKGSFSAGDTYNEFRKELVFTHHNIDGSFLSCTYLRVTPKGTHNYGSIDQSQYFTNIFEGSGFEEVGDQTIAGNTYKVGKVSISSIDYKKKPLFKLEVITVMYNNKSSVFNEYEIFPHQVWGMTNSDSTFGTGGSRMSDTQAKFLNKVQNSTCLQIIHPTTATLPAHCGGSHKSLTYLNNHNQKTVLNWLIPSAYADIDPVPGYQKILSQGKGILISGGVPFSMWEKIRSIKDVKFRTYLEDAILDSFETDIINKQREAGIVPSPYEQTFLQCEIPFDERVTIVDDLLKKISDVNNIDYTNLEYLNPKFGDCIIPYPDKRNKGKVFPHSFPWYKYTNMPNATNTGIAQIGNLYFSGITQEQTEKIRILVEARNSLQTEYTQKADKVREMIKSKSFSGHISLQLQKIEEYQKEYEQKTGEIDAEILAFYNSINPEKPIIQTGATVSAEINIAHLDSMNKKSVYALAIAMFGFFLIVFGILRRKK